MLNQCSFIGNVGKEPDVRSLANGNRVASLSIAVTKTWRDKSSGEKKEQTEWVNVVVFNDGLVKVIENYVSKGSKLFVQGALRTRKYEKDGKDRYVTEVVLDAFNGTIELLSQKDNASGQGFSGAAGKSEPRESYDLNDDIPF